jgi:hypothetical protein
VAHPVVIGPFGLVREDFVRLPDDRKLSSRSVVVVDVGVVLPRHLTEGLFYLAPLGVPVDTEEFVEVHRHSMSKSM